MTSIELESLHAFTICLNLRDRGDQLIADLLANQRQRSTIGSTVRRFWSNARPGNGNRHRFLASNTNSASTMSTTARWLQLETRCASRPWGVHDVWVTAIDYQSGEPVYYDGDIVSIDRAVKNADFDRETVWSDGCGLRIFFAGFYNDGSRKLR